MMSSSAYGRDETSLMAMAGDDDDISPSDSWTVTSSYFEMHGLVRQQLDSFNEFVTNTIQSVVSESFPIEIYEEARADEDRSVRTKIRVSFGQIYVSDPQMREGDGAPEYL
ncbi:hypothetical protein BVRB_028820, partial [Beta vulgaris subsp. vulgaris]